MREKLRSFKGRNDLLAHDGDAGPTHANKSRWVEFVVRDLRRREGGPRLEMEFPGARKMSPGAPARRSGSARRVEIFAFVLGSSDIGCPGRRDIAYKKLMAIVIVQGVFSVDPKERDRFVATSIEAMRSSRQEEGCLEYVIAADPLDPERAVLSERWESMDHLQQHLTQQRNAPRGVDSRPVLQNVEITVFEVAKSLPLG